MAAGEPVSFRSVACGLLVSLALACAVTLAACRDDDGSEPMPADLVDAANANADNGGGKPATHPSARDAATDGRSESPPIEPDRCTGELPVMQARIAATNAIVDPDWSCYDAAPPPETPMPGHSDVDAGPSAASRLVTFRLGPAQIGPLIGEVTIDFFFGPSTLGAPAVTHRSALDVDGLTFGVPMTVETLSARIHPSANANPMLSVPEFREYGFSLRSAAPVIEGYLALQASVDLIASFLVYPGQRADPERAMIVALVRDCQGREVSGAQFALFDGDSDMPVATDSTARAPRTNYFQFALPSTTGCTFTSNDQAAWVMIDAPTNVSTSSDSTTHSYRLRLSGRMHATDATPVVIGERDIELFPRAITFVQLYR
jgi:hypothetical protein